MTEIVNTATIKVVADASGVEAGLRPVDDAVAKTGKNLENLGVTAKSTGKAIEGIGSGAGMNSVGEGAGTAATKVDRATRTMAESIQRATQATAALSAGAKGTAENYAALARARGINPDALKPFLAQLDDAKHKADLAADAQRRLDESTKFMDSLKSRTEGIGKSASELAQLRAAQLGVSEAAAPMIAKMREAEQAGESAYGSLSEKAEKYKGVVLAIAAGIAAAGVAATAMISNAINDLGDLDDMAQKTGSSVESLSKIQKVVAVFGPNMGAVSSAIDKLAKGMATVDDDSNKAQRALSALGVSAKDASKKLRDPSEVLVDVAKKLQGYNDGAAKTALITDLVGKSGAELLPFLNDLAENYDKMAAVSTKAAGAGAAFQDQMGWMKLRLKEVFTAIAVDALPALSDLAGAFLDAYKGQDDLVNGQGKQWADDMAVGIARIVDVAALLPRIFSAVSSSFKVVGADISVASSAAAAINPVTAIKGFKDGKNVFVEFKNALADRNKILASANAEYDALWNKPANNFEQALLSRIAARTKPLGAPPGPKPEQDTKDLNYRSGNDPAEKAEAAAAKKEAEAYATVTAAIQGKIEQNKLELATSQDATEAQKLQIKFDQEMAAGKLKLSDAHKAVIQDKLGELAASEQLVKAQQAEKDSMAWMQQSAQARNAANATLATEYQLYGQSADARDIAMVAVKAEADLEKFLGDERRKGIEISEEYRAQLEAERDMYVEVAQAALAQTKALAYSSQLKEENKKFAAQSISDPRAREQALLEIDAEVWRNRIKIAGEGTEAQKALQQEFDVWYANRMKGSLSNIDLTQANAVLDIMSALDESAKSAAQGMADSFGHVGSAIGQLTTSLSEYGRTQAAIAAQLAAATKNAGGDQGKISTANAAAAAQSAQAQIKSYGDMGNAAQSFFKENTAGYRAMQGVEKTFRAFEMAMAVQSMLQKTGLLTTYTAASIAGKTAETQAALASVGPEVAASMAKGQAAAVAGVAGQAQGDPYSAWARMAAMAAVMVGLGFAVSGAGGGDTTAADRQASQGTGSVLGDKDAKSESISKALDLIEKNTYQDLSISGSMLASLRNIETSVASFASQLVSSTDITNPTIGLNTNNGLATTVATAGLTAGGAAVGGMAGAGLSAFTTAGAVGGPIGMIAGAVLGYLASKSSFVGKIATSIFGGKQSVQDSGFTMDAASLATILSAGAKADQYADIKTSGGWFRGDKSSVQTTSLGDDANRQFTAIITSMADSIKAAGGALGMTGDDFTNKLNSFVVDIGKISLKDLKGDELQKAIESVFSKLGDDMAQYAVGDLQQFQQIGEGYLETLARVATEYQTIDVVFESFGKTFGEVGLASIGARDRLVQLAGGLDKFTSQGEYFLSNFFSEQEQAAALKKRIDPTLTQYGLSTEGADASKMFRDFIVGLDATTEAGAQAYSVLMSIAPTFKQIVDAQKGALDEQNDLLDLQAQTYEALGDKVGAATVLEKQRALALQNLSPAMAAATRELWAAQAAADAISKAQNKASGLMNSVDTALSTLQSVVTREKTAIQTSIDVHTASVTKLQSLSQSLHSTLDSLSSPDQKFADRAVGQAQIRAALVIAKAGGPLPDADGIKNALSAVTQDVSSQFSSYTDYLRDLYQTQNDIASLAGVTDDSLSVEEKSLDALNAQVKQLDLMVNSAQAQVDILKGSSTTLLSISQALSGFQLALVGAQKDPINAATAGITNAYQTALGRTPDTAGMEYWTNQATAGQSLSSIVQSISGSMEAQVQGLYKELLGGRGADAGGLSYWVQSGQSIDAIRDSIKQSDEYKKLHGIPGFAAGGMFGGGLRIVGENGPELEATGPSRIWSSNQTAALLAGAGGGGNTAALEAAVARLTREVEGLRVEARAIAGHTEKTSRITRALENDTLKITTEVE